MQKFILFTLAVVLACGRTKAQIFSPLHVGGPGGYSAAGLVLSSNRLFGTTIFLGTVFAVNTDGSDYTNLYSFNGGDDGDFPYAGLVLSSNTLYGTASGSGAYGSGTIFRINTDGTCFTNLHSLSARSANSLGTYTNSDGATPYTSLVLSGNTLYGTAYYGGTNGEGAVFAVNTDGTGFTNLHNFTGGNDGASPYAGLTLSGNILYGEASDGGRFHNGTIFAINTDGTGFTNLYDFSVSDSGTNSDGANPAFSLILSGNTLYGTAYNGGRYGFGTVFAVNTDGTDFTNLHDFDYWDGEQPETGCIVGNTLYGATQGGGPTGYGLGTVFAINTDGTGFTTVYDFAPYIEGVYPGPDLILSGNTLYGTSTSFEGQGAVFALSLGSIPLNTHSSGQSQILTWGNPAFSLQSAPALTGQWTTLSNAASPYTINATNAQSFFRLVYTNSP